MIRGTKDKDVDMDAILTAAFKVRPNPVGKKKPAAKKAKSKRKD